MEGARVFTRILPQGLKSLTLLDLEVENFFQYSNFQISKLDDQRGRRQNGINCDFRVQGH